MLQGNASGSCSSSCPSSGSFFAKVLPIQLEANLSCCLWLFCNWQEFTPPFAELLGGLSVHFSRLRSSCNRNCTSNVSTMCLHPKFVTHKGHKVYFVCHPHHWWKHWLWYWLQRNTTLSKPLPVGSHRVRLQMDPQSHVPSPPPGQADR